MNIIVFNKGDDLPELPFGLSDDDILRGDFEFGVKIVQKDGKYEWQAATEIDYRNSEAIRLGIDGKDVVISGSCVQLGPRQCSGGCFEYEPGSYCSLLFNPQQNYYYCKCA